MQIRSRPRRARRGGVLIATLVLVTVVAALSVCLLELDSTRLKRQVASIDNKRAFNLAEAGLAEGFFGMRCGRTGGVGTREDPARYGDGLFWVESTDLGDGLTGLESTGMAGSGRVTLSLVVESQPRTIGSLGVLGGQEVVLGPQARVDAYDSRAEPEADPEPTAPLRSNGNITLGLRAQIDGDATPGPQSSVLLGLLARVTGSMSPATNDVELPTIAVPDVPLGENVVHSGSLPLTLQGDGARERLEIKPNARVVLTGPARIVVDQLIVRDRGELSIDDSSGAVELYVTDWLDLENGSRLSFSSRSAPGFSMMVSATGVRDRDGDGLDDPAVRFLPTGPFYGTLYAPGARVTLPSSFELFGTVAAERLTLGYCAQVHFDLALESGGDGAGGGESDETRALSWRIVEIPIEVATDLSVDPFEALSVDRGSLKSPADSHEEAEYDIYIQYIDRALARKSYRGPESGFDWSDVLTVLNLVRNKCGG